MHNAYSSCIYGTYNFAFGILALVQRIFHEYLFSVTQLFLYFLTDVDIVMLGLPISKNKLNLIFS